MACVIAFNSVVMAAELDVPWGGWAYVENGLLVVYGFELAIRLKRQGCHFFVDRANIVWNWLDFIMVVGGVLDLWLMPLMHTLQNMLVGENEGHGKHQGDVGSVILRLLKLMRILRVLRLV